MKKTETILSLLILALISGCASAPLPKEEREYQYTENTTASKVEAFQRVVTYLGKTLVDSNDAIKVKDETSGRVIARVQVDCNEFKSFGDILGNFVAGFNVEVEAKDKKVRMTFEGLYSERRDAAGNRSTRQFTSKGDMENGKPCVERLKAEMLKAINSEKKDW